MLWGFYADHIFAAITLRFLVSDLSYWRTWENDVMEQPVYDAGVAGSVTMIFLTLATVILLRSFYKRWKRMEDRRQSDESK